MVWSMCEYDSKCLNIILIWFNLDESIARTRFKHGLIFIQIVWIHVLIIVLLYHDQLFSKGKPIFNILYIIEDNGKNRQFN